MLAGSVCKHLVCYMYSCMYVHTVCTYVHTYIHESATGGTVMFSLVVNGGGLEVHTYVLWPKNTYKLIEIC